MREYALVLEQQLALVLDVQLAETVLRLAERLQRLLLTALPGGRVAEQEQQEPRSALFRVLPQLLEDALQALVELLHGAPVAQRALLLREYLPQHGAKQHELLPDARALLPALLGECVRLLSPSVQSKCKHIMRARLRYLALCVEREYLANRDGTCFEGAYFPQP